MNLRPFIAALLLVACTGCSTVENFITPPPPPDPKTLMPALEQRIAVLVADERQRIDPKAKPLMIDPELSAIARKRVEDMAAKKYMAHVAPDGETAATLLMAEDARFQGLLGENIAAQYFTPSAAIDVDALARRFVDSWLASEPHKKNLAFADYDHTGIGAAVNGDTIYVMQLFSTDLGLGPHTGSNVPSVATPVPDAATGAAPPPEPNLRGSEGTHE
ncbi:MAG: CAP domain-containing protein [Proteobacteria bacterium]|nr:CAP domain-containing protein [Pseudomonadota bacterium]